MRVENPETLAAVVFLRSVSGKSLRELATGPLPPDLDAYRPPPAAVDTVRHAFDSRGFDVFADAQRLTLTLEGERALFAEYFGVPEARLADPSRRSEIELTPPSDIRSLIERIRLLPPPVPGAGDAVTSGAAGPDLAGSTIGRFRIVERVGAGGMGEVYRAEDTELRRTVAIKRLTPRTLAEQGQEASSRQLLREARRASALNHPRIASVFDVFTAEGQVFLVMEYVDGVTLRDRLGSPLALGDFFGIAEQCAEALAAAHQKGILHGDLKPTNIMLTRDGGAVKVCDFGVARRLAPAAALGETTSTARRGITGTPAYMAPEMVLEQKIDARADIFSLGVVLYEMLAGSNPFLADSLILTLDRIRTLSPDPLDRVNPGVPPALSRLVERMIAKEPAMRVASAASVSLELSTIREATAAAPARRRWSVTKTVWLFIAAALLLTALIVPRIRERETAVVVPAEVNLVVLPFTGSAGAGDRQFFLQGLTESVNRQLSRLTVDRKFQVANIGDVRSRNVRTAADARDQLGANVVLAASVDSSDGLTRIVCALIETRSLRPLNEERIVAAGANPIDARNRVVQAVVRMMGLQLTPQEQSALAAEETRQPGAYDFYLQARGYLLNFDRIESLDNAVAVFRRALQADPRFALAYAGLGQAYWRKYELTNAVIWVEPSRAACEGALAIDATLAEPHACLGMVLNGTGEYEKAAAEFATAVDREPTNDLSCQGLATAYEKLGRHADAERTYRRAIELRPHYWAAYNTLGGYYYRLGRYQDALAMFQQVVALAPDSFRGHSSLGAVYFMLDRTAEAASAFEKSLAIRPNYVAASNLGTLYFFDGQYRPSAEAFRQALSLDEGNHQVWGNLAGALEWAGDPDGSKAAYTRAAELAEERIRINPRDAGLHMALAEYRAATGDTAKGLDSLAEVLKLAPSDASTLFQLAVFYESRLARRGEALTWLARAVERGQAWREIDRSPFLIDLRKDPRFQQLRRAG